MQITDIRELEKQVRDNQDSLLSSLLSQNGFSYSNYFQNCGQKVLGEAMYQCLKDLVKISQVSWTLEKDDFKQWIDEAFDEIKKDTE